MTCYFLIQTLCELKIQISTCKTHVYMCFNILSNYLKIVKSYIKRNDRYFTNIK